tara:strand:- start:78555 stop:79157 length:603 start_codon:yes stop_codon:yes gene_type:complete
MKSITSFLLVLLSTSLLASLSINPSVFDNSKREMSSHQGEGRFSSYLSMDINYRPVKELFSKLEKELGVKLKNRGEAHITVMTPVEYFDVLKEYVSITEIENIARESKLQSSRFSITCIGEGKFKELRTYYIVVKSQEIMDIRKKIEKLFLSRGGKINDFSAKKHHPHITLGFTKRDLHESDGVIKDDKTCRFELLPKID